MDRTVEYELDERELVAAFQHNPCVVVTGSQSSGSQMAAVGATIGDVLGGQIDTLRHARAALAASRKRLMK